MNDRHILSKFSEHLKVYETRWDYKQRSMVRQLKQSFFVFIPKLQTYGMHRGFLDDLLKHLNHSRVSPNEVEIHYEGNHRGKQNYLILNDNVVLRDQQPDLAEFILEKNSVRILKAFTGCGKTVISLYAIAKSEKRTVITMSATHVSVWLKDAGWVYENSEEIIVIRGKKC